jgi:hypothetical protein
LLVILLLWQFSTVARFSIWAIAYPFELDYGEGVVWQQMRLITTGRAFGAFSDFPAIANNYPPVFHLLIWSLTNATGADPLAAGRAISLAAVVMAACLTGTLMYRLGVAESGRTAARAGALVGALLLFSTTPIAFWTPVMRVDMLALAISLGGIYLTFRALERPEFIYLAAIAFVLAVYTKQTMLAAPAACFIVIGLRSPRTAINGIVACLVLGGASLAGLCWATDGGFARHIFGANINRFKPELLLIVPLQILIHAILIGVAFFAVKDRALKIYSEANGSVWRLRQQLNTSPSSAMSLILLMYLIFTTIMLVSISKSGSNLNYMIEWFFAVVIFVGLRVTDVAASVKAGEKQTSYAVFLLLALAVQILVIPQYRKEATDLAEMTTLSALVRSATSPVISDDMVLLLRSGKEVLVEPGYVAELSGVGTYDTRNYIRKIRNQEFAFFVTDGVRGERMFDSRYSPDVVGALYDAYPRKYRLAGLTLHLPDRSH